MRRRLNYANVTATLALFFALSGGALAAKHYVISSTNQINPKVLRALKGKTGPTGPAGANGANGTNGAPGTPGKEGSPGKEGKEGKAGAPGAPATKLWAVVSAAGTLEKGSGALSVENVGGGVYRVTFNRNITNCAFLGTVGHPNFENTQHGDIDVQGAIGTEDTLYIDTFDNAGTAAERGFNVAVFC
jgi:hypothetical protein